MKYSFNNQPRKYDVIGQKPSCEFDFELLTEQLANDVWWNNFTDASVPPEDIFIHLYEDSGALIGTWNVEIDYSPSFNSQRCGTVKML